MIDFRFATFMEILLVQINGVLFQKGHVSSRVPGRSLPSASLRLHVARGQVLMNAYMSPPAARRPARPGAHSRPLPRERAVAALAEQSAAPGLDQDGSVAIGRLSPRSRVWPRPRRECR